MDNETVSKNFIENIIDKDLADGVYDTVHTRFPPEPNGYLHIGHAKSILLNYGLAKEYNGKFNMRFDDTNPTKEKSEFVESIKADIKWLGADWEDRLFFASDYFGQMYEAAIKLIKKGKAYVCDLTADEIRQYRGTLTEPGKESPYRNRSVEENLQLFEEMKEGKYADGEKVLRAKIDMASPNMNMRDPVIYRVAHMTHHRTGDTWCIYPMYDFAHPIEDAIEGITHSICTLEFEDHRPLYDWVVRELEYPQPPKQIEFAKLYLTNVVTGKRYIKKLANITEISFIASKADVPEEVMSAVVPGAEIFIPLDDIMDYEAELDRLQKEKKKLEGEVKRVKGKLSNEGFVSKAPQKVVEEEKAKQVKYEEMLAKVCDRLAIVEKKVK